MSYIIEHATLLKSNGTTKTSLLIKENKIEFMKSSLNNYRFIRMDMSSYLLTPGYVMLDFSLQSLLHFQEFKQHMIEKYVKKGCTTLLTVTSLEKEQDLLPKLKQRRQLMINSPIDYYIGVKIPFKLLKPSLLRKLRQHNISVVFVELSEDDCLDGKSWGWIRDAMFSNPITLIPSIEEGLYKSNVNQKILKNWVKHMKENRISSLTYQLTEGETLTRDELMTIGIYPEKGDIRIGGQVNYNLYNLDDIKYHTDGQPIMNSSILPMFTIHQGKLININGEITFNPGIGEECFIPISGRFISHQISL
ncbi:hypothetical protein JOC75_002416 [Metabacillus crassostreae]|uniref:hypothetical protein n=1 Tax=Metabacillus crassostreae TaxID=929098 RepID=UPI00195AAA8F|nr:hypothetical protein [Metabacillus crassostreae]MBM7604413.1 hypothetical protein [Metabacillus crassostreae]